MVVDTVAERGVLGELTGRLPRFPVRVGLESLLSLLSTPFRHPPLRNGSRFGTRLLRGILYGARELPTALAEVAYYRLVFLDGSAAGLGDLHLDLTALWFRISAPRGVGLSEPPLREHAAQ